MDPLLILVIIAAILIPLGMTWLSNRSKRESATSQFVRAKSKSDPKPETILKIRALISDGNKIEAIKVLRDATGLGLAEAKEMVEQLGEGGMFDQLLKMAPMHELPPAELVATVRELLNRGDKIEAIKLVRERMQLDLKDAKELVDRLE